LKKSIELKGGGAYGEIREESPSTVTITNNVEEEEPPSNTQLTNRHRLFNHVSNDDWNNWRWQFQNRITTVEELKKYIPLSVREKAQIKLVTKRYPLSITPYYLTLINLSNQNDPIRKQAVPSFHEVSMCHMGCEDPLGEQEDSVVPGLVHRYPDRALMVMTDLCPVFCRHCTRKREWIHGCWTRSRAETEEILHYIRNTTAIRDVIISGGDPLTLSTQRLEEVITGLRQIPHVEIIRIGTRCPVVLPQRIDEELCAMLSRYGPIWINTHFNHPDEITEESASACDRLLRCGIPVNNQSVLLRGVNDCVETQIKLSHKLLRTKVRPYYLFQCDEVVGTEHLRTPVEVGLDIINGMRGFTSGLGIPTFVIDLPQGGGKVPIQPDYLLTKIKDELILRNYEGKIFHYRDPQVASTNGNRNGNGHKTATEIDEQVRPINGEVPQLA
jgi:lysine 2,3-aminomutase